MLSNPHPTVVLALASCSVSFISLPLGWGNSSSLGGVQQLLCIACTAMAMVYAAGSVWAIFVRWQGDSAHPAILLGSAAIAVSATSLPLFCAGPAGQSEPHPAFFVAIAVIAIFLASATVFCALSRLASEHYPDGVITLPSFAAQNRLKAFPESLTSAMLDDIADTYEAVRTDIGRAVENGTCNRHFIRSQARQLRSLADRIDVYPTADAIRSEARLFVLKANVYGLLNRQLSAAQFIQHRCRQRFAAAVLATRKL